MSVLDVVKHVGAGIPSVLPLGVAKLAALVYSSLPENDRTSGIDWLVSAHAAFNIFQTVSLEMQRQQSQVLMETLTWSKSGRLHRSRSRRRWWEPKGCRMWRRSLRFLKSA